MGGIEEEEVQQDRVCQSIRGRVFGGLVELGWEEGVRRAQGNGQVREEEGIDDAQGG